MIIRLGRGPAGKPWHGFESRIGRLKRLNLAQLMLPLLQKDEPESMKAFILEQVMKDTGFTEEELLGGEPLWNRMRDQVMSEMREEMRLPVFLINSVVALSGWVIICFAYYYGTSYFGVEPSLWVALPLGFLWFWVWPNNIGANIAKRIGI